MERVPYTDEQKRRDESVLEAHGWFDYDLDELDGPWANNNEKWEMRVGNDPNMPRIEYRLQIENLTMGLPWGSRPLVTIATFMCLADLLVATEGLDAYRDEYEVEGTGTHPHLNSKSS